MTFSWEPYYKKILALEFQGLSQAEIASRLSEEVGETVTRDMIRHALPRAHENVKTVSEMPKPDRIPYVTKYYDYITGEKAAEAKNWKLRGSLLAKSKAKVLVHADLHIPFHDEEKFEESINKNVDADAYVGVADFLDCYDHSVFDKGMDIPFVFEVDEALRILEYLSETFPVVELLEANHEARVRKTIERNLPPSLQFLAEKNIMKTLAKPFPNIIVHSDLWFFQLGSVLYSHPEKASKIELRAAMDVVAHFKEWQPYYGLKPWNTVLVAHTHGQSVGYTSECKVIEMGCLCKPMSYALSPKIPYKHPQRSGYVVITLNEGVAVWDESREYTYPIEKGL